MLPETNVSLTQDQITQIESARKLIPALKVQIRKARQAGIDVTQQESDLIALEQQLDKLYRVYVRNIPSNIGA